ncbi:MAG: response regulator transcription factor [Syntrophaceae bacterium]
MEDMRESGLQILMIDDDRELCALVRDYLSPFGYVVEGAYTGPDGLALAENGTFAAVILDVMLPGMDGFEVLKKLRQSSNIPVLMLTARGEDIDRILGLEMGADDYLPKTFSTRELLARLRAVTRRSFQARKPDAPVPAPPIIVGGLRIEPAARMAYVDEAPMNLTPVEFDLILCLAKAAGHVLTRDQLLDAIAGRDYEVFDRSIDVHISSLRRKLNDDPRNPRFIRTVRTAGYLLIGNTERKT